MYFIYTIPDTLAVDIIDKIVDIRVYPPLRFTEHSSYFAILFHSMHTCFLE